MLREASELCKSDVLSPPHPPRSAHPPGNNVAVLCFPFNLLRWEKPKGHLSACCSDAGLVVTVAALDAEPAARCHGETAALRRESGEVLWSLSQEETFGDASGFAIHLREVEARQLPW